MTAFQAVGTGSIPVSRTKNFIIKVPPYKFMEEKQYGYSRTGIWFASIYFIIFCLVAIWEMYVLFIEGGDGMFFGIMLAIATLPSSFIFLAMGEVIRPLGVLFVPLGFVLNSYILYVIGKKIGSYFKT